MVLAGLVLVLSPAAAFAAITGNISSCGGGGLSPLEQFICKIGDILNIIIPILIVLAIVYFIWGVIQYVISDDEEVKQAGRNRIIFGIIGLIAIINGIFFRNDKLIDEVALIIGGFCLTVYSLHIGDAIFVILQLMFTVVAVYDLVRAKKRLLKK